jgi:hypothetical protein
MKKIILKATVLAAAMAWASASFAGSGVSYSLFIKVENTGAGDQVTWSRDDLTYYAAQQTAVAAESSSWALDISGGAPFHTTSGTFSQPVSFNDETRSGYFDIVTFVDDEHLTLDVRQAVPTAFQTFRAAADYSTGYNYYVYLNSAGSQYTNAVPVPEPSSYALMLLGLVAAGVAAKRRKTKQA